MRYSLKFSFRNHLDPSVTVKHNENEDFTELIDNQLIKIGLDGVVFYKNVLLNRFVEYCWVGDTEPRPLLRGLDGTGCSLQNPKKYFIRHVDQDFWSHGNNLPLTNIMTSAGLYAGNRMIVSFEKPVIAHKVHFLQQWMDPVSFGNAN